MCWLSCSVTVILLHPPYMLKISKKKKIFKLNYEENPGGNDNTSYDYVLSWPPFLVRNYHLFIA